MPRDYCNIASLREARYDTARLIRLARERDAGLELADFVEAARHLDQLDDTDLAAVLPEGAGTRRLSTRRRRPPLRVSLG